MKIITNTPPRLINGRYYAEMYNNQIAILAPEAIYIYDVANSAPKSNQPIEGSVLVLNNNIEFEINSLNGLGNPLLVVGLVKAILPLLIFGGGGYYLWSIIKNKISDKNKGEGEAELDTPQGQIAQLLKTEFDRFGKIDPTKYVTIMAQSKPADLDKIARLYNLLTGRRLTDDISSNVSTETQNRAKKIQTWNNNAYSTINIIDDKIIYKVKKADKIRFTPAQTTAIPYYKNPSDIANTAMGMLQPSKGAYTISDFKEVTVKSTIWKQRYDLVPLPLPVNTYKKFAMALINISYVKGKPNMVWVDLTKFITLLPHGLNGIENNSNFLFL